MDPDFGSGNSHVHYSRELDRIRGLHDSILRPRATSATVDPSRQHRRRQINSLSGKTSSLRSPIEDLSLSSFSDEYDLAHEDPQILHDVQRALKGKAKRDARVKAGLPSPTSSRPEAAPHSLATPSSPSSTSRPTFSGSASTSLYHPPGQVDFSPSTASSSSHPIPRSSDNGVTLDWSSHDQEVKNERRWSRSLSGSKIHEKNTVSPTNLSTQEHLFIRHIDGIRSRVAPQTLYKAELVGRQIDQRYAFLETPGETLLKVFRWYSKKDQEFRDELENSEPFLWLSHHDRKKRTGFQRSPLYLSALVIERYQVSKSSQDSVSSGTAAIPEDRNWSTLSFPKSNLSVPGLPNQFGSMRSSNPSLTVNHFASLSQEDDISFQPGLRSGRNSFDSRRSVESFPSTQDPSRSLEHIPSPNSSHLRIREIGLSPLNKEDVVSPRPSYSEEPHLPKQNGKSPENDISMSPSDAESGIKVIISRPPSEGIASPLASFPARDSQNSASKNSLAKGVSQSRTLGRRAIRTSLPSSSSPSADIWEKQRQEHVDEEKLRVEYERKAHLVNVLQADNARTRVILNSVAQTVREYDSTYCKVMQRLGLPHIHIPAEVLEAFSHDPAAITHRTRLHSGWRATEDIHARVIKQRQILHSFIAREDSHHNSPPMQGVLDRPIAELLESLSCLERERQELTLKEAEVAKSLKEVQILEAEARTAYDKTSSITSVVYPELSQITSLEESHKNQYQRVWDWMLGVLTLIFDTITPIWRTYGRTILDDVTAFLVIPLYRNEFTGETRRYPITQFPRRSITHWVGLFLFLGLSISVLFFHGRMSISLLSHLTLPNVEHTGLRLALIPFFWAFTLSQCISVVFEFIVVALQVVTWFWWLGWVLRIVS